MKILELELLTANIKKTKAFYEEVLGLLPYKEDNKKMLFYQVGGTKLIFKKSEEVKPVYHFAIDIPNNRFEEAYAFIKKNTALLTVTKDSDIADFVNWNAKSFYFYDNNGNIVECITRYTNNTKTVKPFDSDSYIAVSEIGLVTNNVPRLTEKLKVKFGIPVFHRQPAGEKFTVCGDDDGLFILVESGREWYPSNTKAFNYPARIVFLSKGVIYHLVE